MDAAAPDQEPPSPMADAKHARAHEAADPAEGGGHGQGTKAVLAALGANLAIAVAKFVGFLVTGASSMLAESVHSVADSGNQLLLLLGGRRARKEADERHPFGYGRERYFWGFVVALVLFTLGSLFAIYEGLHKIDHPEELTSPQWAIGILLFAVLAEGFSFRTAIREADAQRGEASYWRFIRRAKSPELPVVLLEDFGALVGLVLALTGIVLSIVTDDPVWDGYGTLAIGVLLGIVAVILVWEMKSLLIGESAARKDVEAMTAAIASQPEVVQVIHLRAEHLGPDELLVGAKVEFLHDLSVIEVSQAIDRVERSIRAGVPSARLIFIEPDVHRDHRASVGYVEEHHTVLDPDDPDYATLTGQVPIVDEEIWDLPER